jgi:hypothetical protein
VLRSRDEGRWRRRGKDTAFCRRLRQALDDPRASALDLAPLLRQERLNVSPGGDVTPIPALFDQSLLTSSVQFKGQLVDDGLVR